MLLVSRRRCAAALTLACALPSGLALASPQTPAPASGKGAAVESWAIDDATTSVTFDVATLGLLGVTVKRVGNVRENHLPHHLSVAPAGAPWLDGSTPTALEALMGHDGFRGFTGGTLSHRGGFLLGAPGGTIDLSRLTLRPGADPKVLELVDAKGTAWLATAGAQWELERADAVVRYLNADVVILPGLARRLGHDVYAGMTVGVLALDATLHPGKVPAALPPVGAAPPACGVWDGTIDVGLTNMASIGQAGIATVNGRSVVVVLPSADLKNVGTGNVPWFSKFTNLGVAPWNDQHPFLVWQMTRVLNGIFEPIGRSDLKHAFLTLNTGCDAGACTDSHILGLGCSDVYSTSTNNSTGSLAPRNEVTASTGLWNHCGGVPSHFDTNGDCVQDFSGSGENSFTHGLKAAETDLQTAGATYFVEAFYIVRNDINIFNSMGYRQVTPTKPASVWSFPVTGAYVQGPAVNAWVNPTTPGANAANNTLDTGEGHVQLAVKVTDIAGGKKTFAYALQNHDFDRRIKSFHLPFNGTIGVIENIGYHDGDGFAANDWTATVDASGITWTAPAATTPPAELDYASVVSFHFDSDQAVAPLALSTLGVFEDGAPGAPTELSIQTLVPASGPPPGYAYYTVTPCRLLDTRTPAGGAAPIANNTERALDVAAAACGVPAGAIGVALNLTSVGSTVSGEIAIYALGDPTTQGTVDFPAGRTRANNGLARLSAAGKLGIKPLLSGPGSTHVIVDVMGYFGLP